MDDISHDTRGRRTTISCDDCAMRCTAACDDCVVTFLLGDGDDLAGTRVELDDDQSRVVHLLGKAGLVPELRFHEAS